jgi:predicted phosphodiesterase
MKIAFTSCCDPVNDKKQVAWTKLAEQNPDILILLGDNIYMDYGLGKDSIKLKAPKEFCDIKFADAMHQKYAKQWAIPSFHAEISQIPNIYAIWDDHDFAWNNSRGEGEDSDDELVSNTKRAISKILFEQFREVLSVKPASNNYPPNLVAGTIKEGFTGLPYTGIQQTIFVQLHLLDGRSFRPERDKTKSFLGEAQQKALQNKLLKNGGIHLIASGTVLDDWKKYSDKKWLNRIAENANIIVLSGDIHEPSFYYRHRIFEFTASAMAQPSKITTIFGKESNVFGILEIFDKTIITNIYQWNVKKQELITRKSAEIDRKNWVLTGISGKSNEYSDTE